MIPVTVDGIVVLVLLVLPGLHYDLLRERHRPDRGDSPFFEISRVLLSGVLLSGITLGVLGLAYLIDSTAVTSYSGILTSPRYVPDHITLTASSIAWFVVISLTLGACVAAAWPTETSISSYAESAWTVVFSRIPQQQAKLQKKNHPDVEVEVRVKDGQSYRGRLDFYSKNAAIWDRELILLQPLSVVSSEGVESLTGQEWHQLVLPASEIAGILVKYRARPSPAQHNHPSTSIKGIKTLPIHVKAIIYWTYEKRRDKAWLAMALVIEIALLFAYAALRLL